VYLFVLSVEDVFRKTPDADREFFRYFKGAERISLQGFPTKIIEDLPPDVVCKAAGNAYPVPLIIAVTHPVLRLICESDSLDFATWPPTEMRSRVVPSVVGDVLSALISRPRAAKPMKRKKPAKALASCKSRKRSGSNSE